MPTQLCSFTAASGSALTSYAVGGESAFTRNTGAGAAGMAVISNANRYRANGISGSIDYINNYTPGNAVPADYWMEADIVFLTFPNSNAFQIGIGVRCGTGASFTGYYLLMESRTGGATVRLSVYRAGNATPLGTPVVITQPAANSVFKIRIGVVGGATPTILTSYADVTGGAVENPVHMPPITPAGADIVTQAGVPGVYSAGVASFVSDSTGFHMDNLKVNDALLLITPSTTNMWDNGYAGGSAPHWSPYSSLHLQTDASAITPIGLSTIFSTYPLFAQFTYRIDGINQPVLSFAAQNTSTSFGLQVSGTTSIYEIINGGQAKPSGTLLETYMTGVLVYGYTTLTTLTQSSVIPRHLALVDSVSSGANATNPGLRGYPMQLRYGNTGTIQSYMLDGHGSNSFFDQCPDAASEDTYVAKIAAFYGPAPTTLLFFLGGNDYLLSKQTSSAFQTRVSGFTGKFHTQFPNCKIYLIGFIHLYAGEADLGGGTAAAYRTALSTVAAAAPSYCTYFDMSGYPITAAMTDTDNVHPLSAGHDIAHHGLTIDLGFTTRMNSTGSTAVNTTGNTLIRP